MRTPPPWRARRSIARSFSRVFTQRFSVEFDRRTVGIAVRVAGGFMFYASDERFREMDGRMFRRARAIERQLTKVAQRKAPRTRSLQPA
jgi:hypothetical protein